MRSTVWDMLSLRCCRTSKLRCPQGGYIHGSGAQEKRSGWKNMDQGVIYTLMNKVIGIDKVVQEEAIERKRRGKERQGSATFRGQAGGRSSKGDFGVVRKVE